MRVLVLHTLPPQYAEEGRTVGEFDLAGAAQGIAATLPDAVVAGIRGEAQEVIDQLAAVQPEVVFNLCEAPLGRPDLEAHVAALLEWKRVRFTGSRSETLALCRRKDRVTATLAAAGAPVPRTHVFPCVVKPADEDGSAGIHEGCICENEAQLRSALATFHGSTVVQEFLPGREFAVSLWGEMEPEFESIGETIFQNGLRLNTYAAKWDPESADFVNSPLSYHIDLDEPLRAAVLDAARAAWRVVEARGYLRVDIRLDASGQPKILDVNPNSELSPGVGICRAVEEARWTWQQFVQKQVEWA